MAMAIAGLMHASLSSARAPGGAARHGQVLADVDASGGGTRRHDDRRVRLRQL
jgi:hypothetical protein